ncbi:hypothetical protein C1H46_018498 [Malus baccata]|uniref:(S)-hydroxynitrile lyase n=1 Tax=Malus baccata TaxID=106549 RepID=A0A540MAU4_MALBA|nr:hypothetical protein C1H46_018498 [Malus baccata]
MTEKLLFFFLLFICLAKASTSTPSLPSNIHNKTQSPKHFVLIHGACHGAWSWYKVATLLRNSGHNVTALDLGASGISPIQVQQLPSLSEFVEPLTKVMVSLLPNEKVILVGHSLGGAVISIFMERFPHKVAAAVFVTAIMYGPTLNFSTVHAEVTKGRDFMDTQYRYDNGTNNPATSQVFGPKFMATTLYQLSPPQDLNLALSLVRLFPLYNYDVIKLTKEKYGSVRRVFIVADQDHGIVLDAQNYMIKNNPPNEVKVINGSDHMVMFSKPVELFCHLQRLAITAMHGNRSGCYSLKFNMLGNSSKPIGTSAPATRNLYYSFDVGLVNFGYIPTETNFVEGSKQLEVLKRDLEAVDRKKTPFVVLQRHRPMYTRSNERGDAPEGENAGAFGV